MIQNVVPNSERRDFIRKTGLGLLGLGLLAALPWSRQTLVRSAMAGTANSADTVTHTDAAWRKLLTPEQYDVLRQQGTERPFTSPLLAEHRAGTFGCAGCQLPLFSSKTKFESGTGWPSFWQPLTGAVATTTDNSLFMSRTEVHCHRCGGHLGHVFNDGPQPTGLRYCMNGVALTFQPGPAA